MVGGRMTVMKKIYLLIILIFFSNYAHSKDYKFLCIPKEISKVYNFKTFKFIDEYFDPYQDDIIITINENKLIDEWGKEFVRFKKSTEKIMSFALVLTVFTMIKNLKNVQCVILLVQLVK